MTIPKELADRFYENLAACKRNLNARYSIRFNLHLSEAEFERDFVLAENLADGWVRRAPERGDLLEDATYDN